MYILDHCNEYLDGKLLNKLGAIQKQKEKHILLKYPLFSRSDDVTRPVCMQEKFAQILHRCGVEKVSLVEIHSKSALEIYQGIFGSENVTNISAADIFAKYIAEEIDLDPKKLAIGSPDGGNKRREMAIERVNLLSHHLEKKGYSPEKFYISKIRENDVVKITDFEGDVEGKICVLFDDLVDSGDSMIEASIKLKEKGADKVYCFATHACLSKAAFDKLLKCKPIEHIAVSDTIQNNFKIQPYFYKKYKLLRFNILP